MKYIFKFPYQRGILLLAAGMFLTGLVFGQPNVLFIICDDLNDYEGAFGGHPQAITPHMDRLAASGIRFMNAQTNVPMCQPCRNSLFTGVYPHVSGDWYWTSLYELPGLKNNKTIIQILNENGYQTAGTGKLIHEPTSLANEFTEYSDIPNYGPFAFKSGKTISHPTVPSPYRDKRNNSAMDGSYGRMSEIYANSAEVALQRSDSADFNYVDENNRDKINDELHAEWAVNKLAEFEATLTGKPFFLAVGYAKPHTPLIVPDKYFDMYPLDKLALDSFQLDDADDTYHTKDGTYTYLTEKRPHRFGPDFYRTLVASYENREVAVKHFLQAYLACVSFVDDQIGEVINALDNSRFADNTIVILTSDHGWQMGEKDYLYKNSPWEESCRIPLVVRLPGNQKGGTVDQPVSLIDIFPTLVDYCSLTVNNNASAKKIGGYSLRSLIEDPVSEQWEGPEGALTATGLAGPHNATFSYRTKEYRYIRYPNGSQELYDHTNDKYEWTNQADNEDYSDVKAALDEHVDDIIAGKTPAGIIPAITGFLP